VLSQVREALFFPFEIGMLVNICYDTQAVQAVRALRYLSLFHASRKSIAVCPHQEHTADGQPISHRLLPDVCPEVQQFGLRRLDFLSPLRSSSNKS